MLSLHFHINYGAAFGIFQNRTTMLIIVNILVVGIIFYLLLTHRFHSKLMNVACTLIAAGGIGNLLDRILREGGGVIDYIYFEPINFPIFNFADCCVTVGAGLLLLWLLFSDSKKSTEIGREDAQ